MIRLWAMLAVALGAASAARAADDCAALGVPGAVEAVTKGRTDASAMQAGLRVVFGADSGFLSDGIIGPVTLSFLEQLCRSVPLAEGTELVGGTADLARQYAVLSGLRSGWPGRISDPRFLADAAAPGVRFNRAIVQLAGAPEMAAAALGAEVRAVDCAGLADLPIDGAAAAELRGGLAAIVAADPEIGPAAAGGRDRPRGARGAGAGVRGLSDRRWSGGGAGVGQPARRDRSRSARRGRDARVAGLCGVAGGGAHGAAEPPPRHAAGGRAAPGRIRAAAGGRSGARGRAAPVLPRAGRRRCPDLSLDRARRPGAADRARRNSRGAGAGGRAALRAPGGAGGGARDRARGRRAGLRRHAGGRGGGTPRRQRDGLQPRRRAGETAGASPHARRGGPGPRPAAGARERQPGRARRGRRGGGARLDRRGRRGGGQQRRRRRGRGGRGREPVPGHRRRGHSRRRRTPSSPSRSPSPTPRSSRSRRSFRTTRSWMRSPPRPTGRSRPGRWSAPTCWRQCTTSSPTGRRN